MDRSEALRSSRRLERARDFLTPSRMTVRRLGPVVQALVLAMVNARRQIGECGNIGAQLVGNNNPRLAPDFEQLLEEVLSNRFVAPGLHENVENTPLASTEQAITDRQIAAMLDIVLQSGILHRP